MESDETDTKTKSNTKSTRSKITFELSYKAKVFNVSEGDMCLVQQPQGTGKSTFLLGLLEELERFDFDETDENEYRFRPGTAIAYAAEDKQLYLQSNTIRENILFGLDFDPETYLETLYIADFEEVLSERVFGE